MTGSVAVALLGLDAPAEGQAVLARERQIEQDQVDLLVLEDLLGLGGGAGAEEREPGSPRKSISTAIRWSGSSSTARMPLTRGDSGVAIAGLSPLHPLLSTARGGVRACPPAGVRVECARAVREGQRDQPPGEMP